jgi:hypothetical protein
MNAHVFMKLVLALQMGLLFQVALAQNENYFQAGVYSGFQLGAFQGSTYPSSPHLGWKAGLQMNYELQRNWRLGSEVGTSFLNCHVKNPMMVSPSSVRWKYLWAEVAPLLFYVPVHRSNLDVAVGSGISVRRILKTSVGGFSSPDDLFNERIYPWTYFLPFRLSANLTLANQHRFTFSAEYSAQLRRMYRAGNDNYVSTTLNRMYSWGLVVAYSIPASRRINKA